MLTSPRLCFMGLLALTGCSLLEWEPTSEAEIEEAITNGPIDLAPGTTLGGDPIVTGERPVDQTAATLCKGAEVFLNGEGDCVEISPSQGGLAPQVCASGIVRGIDAKGQLLCDEDVHFVVRLSESYDVGAANYLVDFTHEHDVWVNDGDAWDADVGQFEAPADGLYTFSGGVNLRELEQGALYYAYIFSNGQYYAYSERNYANASTAGANVHATIRLRQGETARLGVFAGNVDLPAQIYGNAATNYAFTWFEGTRIR